MKISFEQWLSTRLGGAHDAMAAMAAFGGGLLANPLFHSLPAQRWAGAAMSAAGFAALMGRVRALMDDRVHVSDIRITSSSDTGELGFADDGVLLGYTVDTGRPLVISWDDWMRHAFIVGQSGRGKTVLGEWLMFQQIVRGGGMLWIDGKLDADNLEKLHVMCAYAGRRDDLLVINPGDPANSNTYNPILYGDPDEVAARVLSLIPSTEGNAGADFYRQKANQGMTTLVSAIQAAGLSYTFGDIAILLQNERALEYLAGLLPITTNGGKEIALFLESLKTVDRQGRRVLDVKKLNELFGGLGGRMHSFGTGNFGKVTGTYTPDVNLYEAIRTNKIIYLALPTMGKTEAASNFGKIAIGDFRSAVAKIQALPEVHRPSPPFLGFFDEAGSYVTQAWSRIFEQSRSAKLVMVPAVQTIANLDAVGKELREMVIGNTQVKICFGIGTTETAEAFSDLFGTEFVASTGIAAGSGLSAQQAVATKHTTGVSAGRNTGYSQAAREVARVTVNDLRSLGKGEAVVLVGGDKVYHIKIPQIRFSREFVNEVGSFSVNRSKRRFARGLRLYEEAHRWID